MKTPEIFSVRKASLALALAAGSIVTGACAGGESTPPSEAVMANIADVNKECGNLAIQEATAKFTIAENDISTPEDEAYESVQAINDEAAAFVEDRTTVCMEANLPGLSGFEIEVPVFTADMAEVVPATVATTLAPVTTLAN